MSKSIFTRSKPNLAGSDEMYGWAKELIDLTNQYPQYRRYAPKEAMLLLNGFITN